MLIVGITGQIASGKSRVARFFEERGAVVISGDQIGNRILETAAITKKLIKRFSSEVLSSKGQIDRSKLARIVFRSQGLLGILDDIVHPPLLKQLRREIAQHKRKKASMIVIDAALIFKWGLERELDYVITVESTKARQIERLLQKGMTRSEAEERIGSQLPKSSQRIKADLVIRNNGTFDELKNRAAKAYETLWLLKKSKTG